VSLSGGPIDLSRASVFIDFDGTISVRSVSFHLLERLGAGAWREVDDRYVRGEIGSRPCMTAEWEAVRHVGETVLRDVAREVPLDDGFRRLVTELLDAGAEVTVVSDGFGFYAEEALVPFRVPVVTNRVDFGDSSISFPNADPSCPCAACGTCKPAPIGAARRRGRTTVFVGDGVSDRYAAAAAERVYAKHRLALWCDNEGVPYVPYRSLDEVREHLVARGCRRMTRRP
jgi:2-hydroxy-3-keto-5-methylthiopentenyl-1-phosphate phosphatase